MQGMEEGEGAWHYYCGLRIERDLLALYDQYGWGQ
jgi:hypothetical protein